MRSCHFGFKERRVTVYFLIHKFHHQSTEVCVIVCIRKQTLQSMDSEDSEQQISVTHQLPGRQLPPAPVEAVIRFGYLPDVVWPIYRQLVSTGSLRDDVIQSDSDAAGGASGDARPHRHVMAAALLLASVENIVSSQFSDSLTGNGVSRSRAAVTRCGRVPKDQAGAGDLEGDGPEPSPRSANRPEGVQDVEHAAHDESPAARETTTMKPVTLTPQPLPPSPPPPPPPTTTSTPAPTTTNASGATTPGVTTTTALGVMTAGASTSTPSSTTAASSADGVEDTPGAESGTTTATSTPTLSGVATAIPDEVPRLQTSSVTVDPTRHVTAAASRSSATTPNREDLSEDRARERRHQLERLRALQAENRRLKARKVCRQCRQRPVALTFLPCGHFCFCQECGSSFSSCPLCRKTILADVRTFVS